MRGWALVAANRVVDAVAEVRAALDVNPWATWCHSTPAQYLWYNDEAEAALSLARDAALGHGCDCLRRLARCWPRRRGW
jgi:hypothetical protein